MIGQLFSGGIAALSLLGYARMARFALPEESLWSSIVLPINLRQLLGVLVCGGIMKKLILFALLATTSATAFARPCRVWRVHHHHRVCVKR